MRSTWANSSSFAICTVFIGPPADNPHGQISATTCTLPLVMHAAMSDTALCDTLFKDKKALAIGKGSEVDRNGFSELTVPFAASALRISDERAAKAFEILAAPDPRSRNKEHGGRRIIEQDGGWLLASHGKWRQRASREAANERQRRHAAKQKAEQEKVAHCEVEGCDDVVDGACDGVLVCNRHAFEREPGQDG